MRVDEMHFLVLKVCRGATIARSGFLHRSGYSRSAAAEQRAFREAAPIRDAGPCAAMTPKEFCASFRRSGVWASKCQLLALS